MQGLSNMTLSAGIILKEEMNRLQSMTKFVSYLAIKAEIALMYDSLIQVMVLHLKISFITSNLTMLSAFKNH